jgi:hypothetical protein
MKATWANAGRLAKKKAAKTIVRMKFLDVMDMWGMVVWSLG